MSGGLIADFPFPEARHEDAGVSAALDEQMNGIAVSVDAAHDHFAVVILEG